MPEAAAELYATAASYPPRLADVTDAETIAQLALETFRENFIHYDKDDLDVFLTTHYTPEKFARDLCDTEHRCWIVEDSGALIAFAQCGKYKLPYSIEEENAFELHRLYVRTSYQGYGLGRILMQRVMAEAQHRRAGKIYLGVWENNIRAQRFYAGYGFTKLGEFSFPPIGSVVDREWVMMKRII